MRPEESRQFVPPPSHVRSRTFPPSHSAQAKIPTFAQRKMHCDYILPDSTAYRTADATGLCSHFGLTLPPDPKEVRALHERLCDQGRPWQVVTHRFCIRPLMSMGIAPALLQPMDIAAIAKYLEITKPLVESDLEAAAEWYLKYRRQLPSSTSSSPASSATATSTSAQEPDTFDPELFEGFTLIRQFPEAFVTRLLNEGGYAHLDDEEDRRFVADKLYAFRDYLSKPMFQMQALQAVETLLTLRGLTTQKVTLRRDAINPASTPDQRANASKELRQIEESSMKMAGNYDQLLERLGATDVEFEVQKRGAIDQVSTLLTGLREWKARGDKRRIDGVFTADEIQWLVTMPPLEATGTPRRTQYWLDVVASIVEDMKPENLYDPNYNSEGAFRIPREVTRTLNRLIARCQEELNNLDSNAIAAIDVEHAANTADTTTNAEGAPSLTGLIIAQTGNSDDDDEDAAAFDTSLTTDHAIAISDPHQSANPLDISTALTHARESWKPRQDADDMAWT